MLQGRLTVSAAVVASVFLAACSSGGALEDNVIRPGITAIDNAGELQCSQDATALRTAIDAYELVQGAPPANEQALIDDEYLREPSDVWDVVDGELIAADPGCGTVPIDIPETEIVTSTEPPMTPDDLLAGFSTEQVEAVGGVECARELTIIFAAGEMFSSMSDAETQDLQDFVDAGVLDALPTLWMSDGGKLIPIEGSGCIALN